MTRKEAIELLVNATYSEEWQGNEKLATAQHMAIEALEKESNEDLISRQVALQNYQDVCSNVFCTECKVSDENGTCKLESFINNLPSAVLEQEPKRGEWIPVSERLPDKFIDCLITVKTDLGELYTCISRWSSFSGKQEFTAFGLPKECFINNSKYMIYQPVPEGNIIAWMPLPEVYKGGGVK